MPAAQGSGQVAQTIKNKYNKSAQLGADGFLASPKSPFQSPNATASQINLFSKEGSRLIISRKLKSIFLKYNFNVSTGTSVKKNFVIIHILAMLDKHLVDKVSSSKSK